MGRRWVVIAPLAALLASACAQAAPEEELHLAEPAHVEPIEGTELARVTLTERAAERIRLRTAPVEAGGRGLVVPAAALIVDTDGRFWVYTSPEPLTFVRHEVELRRIDGDRALAADGPPVGTPVVTVGAQELWGAETGVGGH
jgi:hypothetical protein